MGRGKLEIKFIENPTNRQVTFSKRRNGIFKKAHELTLLCDAKVSLIIFSKSHKMHEYISPGLTTKKVIDQYQRTLGDIDLWRDHYEKMLENKKRLTDINNKLRRQIRQRIGEGMNNLDDLSFQQLRTLEDDMVSSTEKIRERKLHVIKTRTDTCRKKVRSLEQMNGNLLQELDSRTVALANGVSNFHAFNEEYNHLNRHQHVEEFDSYYLRLA
ncbi:agamous-like MADS-box protein TM6 [Lotus japonicus]|uniref:agamous-like MADS-box protein TM6 n=1 Tax=Lotus japonicus TaxID=34305 RepID=UPI00258CD5F9|nr:agamous-like MADS-box protein TM6 [Lotus japonicus]